MEVLGILAGAGLGAVQVLLARQAFIGRAKKALRAIYIAQMPILSLGSLFLVFFLWREALVAFAVGLVASSITLAVIFNLKR